MLLNNFAVRCEYCGDGRHRSCCLAHAKRALYHLSYTPKYQEWDSNPRSITHNILSVTPLTARESWLITIFGFHLTRSSDWATVWKISKDWQVLIPHQRHLLMDLHMLLGNLSKLYWSNILRLRFLTHLLLFTYCYMVISLSLLELHIFFWSFSVTTAVTTAVIVIATTVAAGFKFFSFTTL